MQLMLHRSVCFSPFNVQRCAVNVHVWCGVTYDYGSDFNVISVGARAP